MQSYLRVKLDVKKPSQTIVFSLYIVYMKRKGHIFAFIIRLFYMLVSASVPRDRIVASWLESILSLLLFFIINCGV